MLKFGNVKIQNLTYLISGHNNHVIIRNMKLCNMKP